MSISITTAVLFAVFAALLFLGCPISVGIVISSIVAAVSPSPGIRLPLSPCKK